MFIPGFPLDSYFDLGFPYGFHFNYIHFVPFMSRTSASYLTAYRSVAKFFSSLSHPLTHIRLDNEISLISLPSSKPPSPRSNISVSRLWTTAPTRRSGSFAQGRITSYLCSPLDRWSDLLPVSELTLNQLRPSALDPSLSAWHGLHGSLVDFAAHPLQIVLVCMLIATCILVYI
jgi:hypothetical protein